MPMYDYRCEQCGDFRLLRPMNESRDPQACPDCSTASERTLAVPFFGAGGSGGLLAEGTANKAGLPWRHMCGFGCMH